MSNPKHNPIVQERDARFRVEGNKIKARVKHEHVNRCREVAGRKWNKKTKEWTWPATPPHARDLVEAFQGLDCGSDRRFRKLSGLEAPRPIKAGRRIVAPPAGARPWSEEDEATRDKIVKTTSGQEISCPQSALTLTAHAMQIPNRRGVAGH